MSVVLKNPYPAQLGHSKVLCQIIHYLVIKVKDKVLDKEYLTYGGNMHFGPSWCPIHVFSVPLNICLLWVLLHISLLIRASVLCVD